MSMITAVYPAVIYFRNGLHEYYRIDLNCLPDKLCPIANFISEDFPGWTVIDECIYCIGGRTKAGETYHYTVGMKLNKYNITNPNSTWDLISPNRNLRWYMPSVFAFGRKIYVVSGFPLIFDCYEDEENAVWKTYWGECYNLDSKTWSYLPKLTHIDIESFSAFKTTLMDKTTIVFYSVCGTYLLFYNVDKDEWIDMDFHHPNLLLEDRARDGLEKCDCRYALFSVANNSTAVVCHTTLYWLNNDLCLYGYDYVLKKWVQSNSLQGELAWPLGVDQIDLLYMPLLFYLDNETFVAICNVSLNELGVAIIGVKREALSLNVSLKFSQKFPVDTSDFGVNLCNGMTIYILKSVYTRNKPPLKVFDMDGQREWFPLLSPTLSEQMIS